LKPIHASACSRIDCILSLAVTTFAARAYNWTQFDGDQAHNDNKTPWRRTFGKRAGDVPNARAVFVNIQMNPADGFVLPWESARATMGSCLF
jgi:hypothetical protein